MASYGRVVGGSFMYSTASINRNGDLALSGSGFRKKTPDLTAQFVFGWEEVVVERSGAIGAASKVGQAVSLAALRGPAGRAAAAAVGSTADLVGRKHTVRVAWHSGEQSLIELPDKQFQHLVHMLGHLQVTPEPSPATSGADGDAPMPPGVVGQLTQLAGSALGVAQSDPSKKIARLAALRDQGALTEDEFAAKKAQLLAPAAPTIPAVTPAPLAIAASPACVAPPPPPVGATISTLPASAVPPPPPPAGVVAPLQVTPQAVGAPANAAAPPPFGPAVEPVPTPPSAHSPPPPPPPPPPSAAPPSAAPPPPAAPPTWVADPHGRHELRYWDGSAWTDHVSSGGVQSTDPV